MVLFVIRWPIRAGRDSFQVGAEILGVIAFIATVVGLYRWIGNLAQRV
jgi:hypothetical protein